MRKKKTSPYTISISLKHYTFIFIFRKYLWDYYRSDLRNCLHKTKHEKKTNKKEKFKLSVFVEVRSEHLS